MHDMFTKPIVYAVPGMEHVQMARDRTYKTADGAALRMDVYRPAAAAPGVRIPVVILVPGGPLDPSMTPKDWGIFRSYGALLAASGLAAVTFNHRFHGPARLHDTVQDLADLLSHLRRESSDLGVDTGRMALWAFSGGGFLLAPALRDALPEIKAVLAYYAALDLQVPPPGADGTLTPETRRALSPVAHLGEGATPKPPILVARAGRDNPWMNGAIDRFVAEALAHNLSLTLLTHPDGPHGFDILDDSPRSREILATSLTFLKERLA